MYKYKASKFNVSTCPKCNKTDIIKYGKHGNTQRFKCKWCRKTFSQNKDAINFNSKKDLATWEKYYTLLIEGIPLRQCAKILNISLVTAFKWRHIYLNAIDSKTNNICLDSTTILRHTPFFYSKKGDKNIPEEEKVKKYIYRKMDPERIRSHVGINLTVNNISLSKITIIGKFSQNKALINFKENFKFKSYDYLFGNDRFSINIAKKLNKNNNVIKIKDKYKECFESSRDYIAYLHQWINHFRGVATKYLNLYLHLFSCIFDKRVPELINFL